MWFPSIVLGFSFLFLKKLGRLILLTRAHTHQGSLLFVICLGYGSESDYSRNYLCVRFFLPYSKLSIPVYFKNTFNFSMITECLLNRMVFALC